MLLVFKTCKFLGSENGFCYIGMQFSSLPHNNIYEFHSSFMMVRGPTCFLLATSIVAELLAENEASVITIISGLKARMVRKLLA